MKSSRRKHDSFRDESWLGRYVIAPLNRIAESIVHWFKRDLSEIGKRNVVERAMTVPLRLVSLLIVAPFLFLVTGWASSRQAQPFILGLPAVLTFLVAVAPGLAFNYSKDAIRRSYDGLSIRAITNKDSKAAELYTQKLFSLAPENRDYYVRLASAIGEHKDDLDFSMQLIEQVAVGSESWSINGHLWIAQHLITKSPELNEEDIDTAERHLTEALAVNPNHFTANRLAYDLFMKAKRPEKAIDYARVVAKSEPLASHLLLQLQKDLGRDAEFESTLTSVLLVISEVAYRNPNEISLWGELVACCLQGERYREALSYVETGLAIATDPAVRRNLSLFASAVLVSWHDKLISFVDKPRLQQASIFLNAAMNASSDNADAIRRASNLYLDPSLDSKRVSWIMETLALDDNAYCTHMLIGWRAIFIDKENGVNSARTHWQIANTSSPFFAIALAQLALGVAIFEPEKVPLSLQAVELGMSIAPERSELSEARGMILMHAERWFEARQQFEEVLPKAAGRTVILSKLVECCEKLGDKKKQAEYQAQLDQISQAAVDAR